MREPTDSVPTLTGTDLETVGSRMHRGVARAMCDHQLHSVVVLADGQA